MASTVKRAFLWHQSLGAAFAALLFSLCLSGSLAVFKDELQSWTQGPPEALPPLSLEQSLAAFAAAAGSPELIRRLELDTDGAARQARTHDGLVYQRRADGSVSLVNAPHGIADFLVNYHTRFFAGHIGRWSIGLLGLAFLAPLATGLSLQLLRKRAIAPKARRAARSARRSLARLHQYLGPALLPSLILFLLTGAWLGLEAFLPAPALAARAPLPAPDAPASPPTLDALIARSKQLIPGFQPVFVNLKHAFHENGTLTIHGNLPGRLFRRHETAATFQLASGALKKVYAPDQLPGSHRLRMAIAPLHFGDFSGPLLKWGYAAVGLVCAALPLTGLLLWQGRRPESRLPRLSLAACGACLVATSALPLLAILDKTGLGPRFSGSFRIASLAAQDRSPALACFLALALIATLLACRSKTPARPFVHCLGASALALLLAPTAAALSFPARHALLEGPALGLAATGLLGLALACRLASKTASIQT